MSDLEIARKSKKLNIREVAKKLNIEDQDFIVYGTDKAKVTLERGKKQGRLILVTATSPTPYGEGKTTVSIGLGDALARLGKDVAIDLRQPSMGPVFGLKGGATGGGYSQVVPMEDINLHFTGDFHAITMANNLLAAAIDNHIEQGNRLDIQEVLFHRCLDVNDRSLRSVKLKQREESFRITAASEMMALFCLAKDLDDLKRRLGDIIIGKNGSGDYVLARHLNIEGALTVILKDAFYPNLVQSLEHTPVFIHGGPFANIAHGCSSIRSTLLSKSLVDYTITEAGFGSDLGAEKFFDIKCRVGDIKPDCIVLVTTIRSLKHHGKGILENGLSNLDAHISHLKYNNSNLVVCLNRFQEDQDEEIEMIQHFVEEKGVPFAVSDAYQKGSQGALSLAREVLEQLQTENDFHYLYDVNMRLKEKIDILAHKIYQASSVEYSKEAMNSILELEQKNVTHIPICVSKTQYSISDDKERLGNPKDYSIYVREIRLHYGAKFITVLLGKILTMPGLPSSPNYEKIDLDQDGNIIGLS